jgi:hypothetical protein
MHRNSLGTLLAAGVLGFVSLAAVTISVAQAPPPQPAQMPPGVPPTLVLDLMTAEGASALGAQWRVSDVKVKEVPIIGGTITMRLAGRFGRRLRGYAKAHNIPVVDCSAGERKHDLAEGYLGRTTITQGLFLVLVRPGAGAGVSRSSPGAPAKTPS